MVQTAHLSFFVYQDQSRIGKASLQCGVVDVLSGERIGRIILNPGPGDIDVPPRFSPISAVFGVGIFSDIESYDLDGWIFLCQVGKLAGLGI